MLTKSRFFLFFCLAMFFFFAASAWAAGSTDELSRQESAALEYQLQLARVPADAAPLRENLYLRVIEECPQTEAAEEALWALANLYLDDFNEPRDAKAQEVLEQFIQKYPTSKWLEHVEGRLLWLYEGTENHARVLALFENILKRGMPLAARLPLALKCAQAYERAGQPDKASEWYSRIVKDTKDAKNVGGGVFPEAETARGRLEALKKKQ